MKQTNRIARDLRGARARTHDLIVVGGGIHGVCVLLEAARRGWKPLLVESRDFGGATSFNSLRIIHGGLRYLQTLDLRRARKSATAQEWFLRNLPDLVQPIACLMPLYGRGLRRNSTFSVALRAHSWISRWGRRGPRSAQPLGTGKILDIQETIDRFPGVAREGLTGAGMWYDAIMTNPQRVLIELVRWACESGAMALNYVEAGGLRVESGRILALQAVDRVTGQELELAADKVVNCAGPWFDEVGRSLASTERSRLDVPLSLAFNLLLRCDFSTAMGVAVSPPAEPSKSFFLVPHRKGLLAGTWHQPWTSSPDFGAVAEEQIAAFLERLNAAVPALQVSLGDVLTVFPGIIPAKTPGSSSARSEDLIVDYGKRGGPIGLYGLLGTKYTTAFVAASAFLDDVGLPALVPPTDRSRLVSSGIPTELDLDDAAGILDQEEAWIRQQTSRVIAEESVVRLEDLVFRRTDWGAHREEGLSIVKKLAGVLTLDPTDPLHAEVE